MRAAMIAFLVGGCAVAEPAPEALPTGDAVAFAAKVQPVFDARCADPTCHGRPDRPLSIYSPRRYRKDPARTLLDEPLGADETAANVRACAAFALDAVAAGGTTDDCLILRKPLPVDEGGARHGGGVIFPSDGAREWRILRSWLGALSFDGAPR